MAILPTCAAKEKERTDSWIGNRIQQTSKKNTNTECWRNKEESRHNMLWDNSSLYFVRLPSFLHVHISPSIEANLSKRGLQTQPGAISHSPHTPVCFQTIAPKQKRRIQVEVPRSISECGPPANEEGDVKGRGQPGLKHWRATILTSNFSLASCRVVSGEWCVDRESGRTPLPMLLARPTVPRRSASSQQVNRQGLGTWFSKASCVQPSELEPGTYESTLRGETLTEKQARGKE